MAVYVIIEISIQPDAAKADYARYVEKVRPIVERHGGRYLARGGATPIAGDWAPERVVLIQFPSVDHVNQWWNSPEYKAISGLRERSTRAKAILVEGIENTTASEAP
jgi:uncharacterized protein (DUF1330 family)